MEEKEAYNSKGEYTALSLRPGGAACLGSNKSQGKQISFPPRRGKIKKLIIYKLLCQQFEVSLEEMEKKEASDCKEEYTALNPQPGGAAHFGSNKLQVKQISHRPRRGQIKKQIIYQLFSSKYFP